MFLTNSISYWEQEVAKLLLRCHGSVCVETMQFLPLQFPDAICVFNAGYSITHDTASSLMAPVNTGLVAIVLP